PDRNYSSKSMPIHSEYPLAGPATMLMFNSLQATARYNNVQYGNISLSGPGLADQYDPNLQLQISHLAVKWPGNLSSPDGGNNFDIVRLDTPDGIMPGAARVSKIFMGASVGK